MSDPIPPEPQAGPQPVKEPAQAGPPEAKGSAQAQKIPSAFRTLLTEFDPYLKIIGGLLALIVPAIAAFFAYTFAVNQLQSDTDSKTCHLLIKVGIARAVNEYLEVLEEERRLDASDEKNPSLSDTDEDKKRRAKLEADKKRISDSKERIRKKRQLYEEADKNVWKRNCSEIEQKALGI